MEDGRVLALIAADGQRYGFRRQSGDPRRRELRRVQRSARSRPAPGPSAPIPARRSRPQRPTTCAPFPGPSPGGRFNSAYPLWDGTQRILVSWTRVPADRFHRRHGALHQRQPRPRPAPQIAPPLYSAWLFNPTDNTFKPIVAPTEGVMLTDIVSLQARAVPAFVPPVPTGSTLAGDGLGIIDIRSIYDWADATVPLATGTETNAEVIARMSQPRWRTAPGALPAHREGGFDGRQGPDGRFPGFRPQHLARQFRRLHARDPRLRADRSRRLGAREGAGQRRLPDFGDRRECAPAAAVSRSTAPGCSCARAKCSSATAATMPARQPAPLRTAAAACSRRPMRATRVAPPWRSVYGALTNCGGTIACDAATPSST